MILSKKQNHRRQVFSRRGPNCFMPPKCQEYKTQYFSGNQWQLFKFDEFFQASYCHLNFLFHSYLVFILKWLSTLFWMKESYIQMYIYTVKAPNIGHLSLLTSIGYNKKETNLKKLCKTKQSKHYTLFTQNSKWKIYSRSLATLIWSAQPPF